MQQKKCWNINTYPRTVMVFQEEFFASWLDNQSSPS